MTLRSWIRKLIQPYPRFHGRRGRGGRHRQCPKRWGKPWLEVLEDRLAPATITVMNANDGPDPGPAGSLRNAIDTSASGDTIIFNPSLAGQTITLTRELDILKSLTIIGLGANLLAVSANHADRVFQIVIGPVKIIGLTIENGMTNDVFRIGGGIANFTNLTLTDCTLTGNTAMGQAGANGEGGGGGGAGAGGGICNYGTLNLQGCTLSGNTATGGNGGDGGNSGFGGKGGGFNGGLGSPLNSGTPGEAGGFGGGGGGGSYTFGGGNGTAGGNGGDFGGGGGGGDPGAAPGGQGLVAGNGGHGDAGSQGGGGGGGGTGVGGGLFNNPSGTVTITNCTFSANTAQGGDGGSNGHGTAAGGAGGDGIGAAVFNNGGTITITSSTIAGNNAFSSSSGFGSLGFGLAGGIENFGPVGVIRVDSSIIAMNFDTVGEPDIGDSFTDLGYNLIGNTTGIGTAPTTITGSDPLLAPLAGNGGPTPTMALRFGSPAINNGDPTNGVIFDERGAVRGALSGPGSMANAGTLPDIGAWEASSLNLVTTNSLGDSTNVGTLREAINWANVNLNPTVSNSMPNLVTFDTKGVFSTPQTITLTLGALNLTNRSVPVSIVGPGPSTVTVSGNNTFRVFDELLFVSATTISGITITNGRAAGSVGGAIFAQSPLTLTNVTISNSYAASGGGIFNDGPNLTITNSTISGNSSSSGGGIFNSESGAQLILSNSTLAGNSATTGSAIEQSALAAGSTITDCTITGNTATGNGTVITYSGPITLLNTTLANNLGGGGLVNAGGTLVTKNTILAGNVGGDVSGNIGSLGHNLIQNPTGGSGFVSTDLVNVNPRLMPLANNGGPTQTLALGFSLPGDLTFPANAAVDAGDNSGAPATDQRGTGFARIVNSTIDIGAYEDQIVATAPPSSQTAMKGTMQTFLLGSFTDQVPLTNHTITVLWGDGSPNTTFSVVSPGLIPNTPHSYAQGGTYTATVQVTDADGNAGQETFTVTVSDPNVMAMGGFTFNAIEGTASAAQTVATFTDPGGPEPLANYSATINWGDGGPASPGSISLNGTAFSVSGSHMYAEEGSYTISVTINHGTTAPQSVTSAATISNPGVVALAGSPINAVEAGPLPMLQLATFTDPGGLEAITDYGANVIWGDGSPSSAGVVSLTGTTFTVVGNHTYAEEGTYIVTVTISHETTTPQSVTLTASVSDPNVMATGSFPVSAVEGALSATQTVATFTDPAGAEPNDGTHYSASINWGDGTVPSTGTISVAGTALTVSGNHLYAEEGSYLITVSINHEASLAQTVTSTASVSDPNVVAKGGFAISSTEGSASGAETVATFTDPGGPETLADYSASINWGDGSGGANGAITLSGTTFTVTGSHTYSEEGTYTVLVTIAHESTGQQTVSDPAIVANANLVGSGGFSLSASEGTTLSNQTVATFTDPGGPEALADYSANINWGDGTPNTSGAIAASGTSFIVSGSHTYGEEGTYTIAVTINHENTSPLMVTSTATVSDPAVQGATVALTATAGAPFFNQAIATFTDPGGAEPNSADPAGTIANHYKVTAINWGDGTPLDTTTGAISYSGAPGSTTTPFTVTGSHTYAANGSYSITVALNHEGMPLTLTEMAPVGNLGQFLQGSQQTKTSGFWAGLLGQELLRRFGLTAGGQTVGQWLASTFPRLYGGAGGAANLSNFTDAQVGIYYLGLFNQRNTTMLDSEVMSAALYVFATTSALGGMVGAGPPYSLPVSAVGLGAYSENIGFNGAAFGVSNFAVMNLYQILQETNNFAIGGEPWGTNTMLRNEGLSVFRVINGDG